jgi:enoyl-CoA hydratase
MKDEVVLTEKEDGITTISLNRPEKRNALNPEIMNALPTAFSAAAEDPEVKAVILTGKGKAFSAGIDFVSYPDLMMGKLGEGNFRWLREFLTDLHYNLNKIECLEKPVICAINGYVAGMGLEIALTADFRIATKDSLFGIPEVQLGLIPDVGGTTRLTRMIGIVKAKELIMTGKMITAEEALRINLVNEIVAPDELMNSAKNLARYMIDNCSPVAVGLAKKMIDLGADMDKNTSLEMEGICQSILFGRTEDLMEGFTARAQKRRPNFK